jgi:hypothetical protein
MESIIFNAFITLIISTIIGGYFNMYQQYRGKVSEKIWDERYKVYPILWDLSKFVPKFPPIKGITYTKLNTLSESLREWYFVYKGGVLLSDNSKEAYINLQYEINKIINVAKNKDDEISMDGCHSEYYLIQGYFSKLRTELTIDLMSRKRNVE